MSKTSNVGDLRTRLQQKIQQDRIEIETLTRSELKKLADNLRPSVKDESYIIVRDIKEHTRWMNAALWGTWLRSVVVGVCLFLGICVGSWGLTRWYSNNIQSLIQRRAALTRQVEREQTRLDQLRAQTWGVWLHEAEDGARSMVLPNETPLGLAELLGKRELDLAVKPPVGAFVLVCRLPVFLWVVLGPLRQVPVLFVFQFLPVLLVAPLALDVIALGAGQLPPAREPKLALR